MKDSEAPIGTIYILDKGTTYEDRWVKVGVNRWESLPDRRLISNNAYEEMNDYILPFKLYAKEVRK